MASPSNCLTGQGNIYNATLIMETDQPFEVHGDIGCVGSSVNAGQYSYATIWGDDDLTPEKDGLYEGDMIDIIPFPFERDAIYTVRSATLDTTWSIVLDSLVFVADSLVTQRDIWETRAYGHRASRDSLQAIVDNFPDDYADLQVRIDSLNNRVGQLEGDLAQADLNFGLIVSALRTTIRRLRD